MRVRMTCAVVAGLWLAGLFWPGQGQLANAQQGANLPDLPPAQSAAKVDEPAKQELSPCLVKRASIGVGYAAAETTAQIAAAGQRAALGAMAVIGHPLMKTGGIDTSLVPCSVVERVLSDLHLVGKVPLIDWYARFIDGPQVMRMTPKEKAWLAVRDVADPFNAITILGSSAIAVGANSHSAYGPGMTGWGKYVGVSYSQDMTGEFFGTFLIPSIVHQDPHYHRMPQASMKRRIAHVLYQVVWTQGDDGNGMVNYADLVGFGIDDEIANLYVPGRDTNARASAERYGTALTLAPTENAITEFLPDIARRIHVRAVLIQHIINQVANKGAANAQP
jgi:hypothetical protein